METIIGIFAWYGAAAILVAYGLSSFEIVKTSSFWYQFLNFTGAFGVALVSFSKEAYQPAALNAAWTLIAAIALIRLCLRR